MEFKGFPRETLDFFDTLEKNNSKEWFEANKNDYENYVKNPAKEFVTVMGEMLPMLDPQIQAIPKVNKSLFRINRDTRFSKNKTPYKTNMGILFWSGDRKRMECTGFYFHIGDGKIMLGSGLYMFTKELMDRYRDAVVDSKKGKSLRTIMAPKIWTIGNV